MHREEEAGRAGGYGWGEGGEEQLGRAKGLLREGGFAPGGGAWLCGWVRGV